MTLPAMDVAGRVPRLRMTLAEAGCEALLVSNLVNIRYLTGFTGSAALLLINLESLTFVTDGRYDEQAAEELAEAGVAADIVVGRTAAIQQGAVAFAAEGVATIGLEAEHVSWAAQRHYAAEWFPHTELVASMGLVEAQRLVKDPGEVARIEAACAVADAALAEVAPRLEHGPTEAAFALELDAEMRRQGADDLSFETIVASGPNGSRPHHRPSPRPVERGDLVVVDFGALIDGYHSDMTRTFAIGGVDALDPTQARMLAVVAEAQAAGVAAVSPGTPASEVDAACREVIDAAGWGEQFVHGTGHGVGLDIHEGPKVSALSTATLAPGHVVTVEPGVYLPGHGGVRIEDTVVVTASGCQTLTRAPKS